MTRKLVCEMLTKAYPNQWVILKSIKRLDKQPSDVKVYSISNSKQDIFDEARGMYAEGYDIFIIYTGNAIADNPTFLLNDDDITAYPFISAEENAFMFRLYYNIH